MEHVNKGEAHTHNQNLNQNEQHEQNNMNNRKARKLIKELTSSNLNFDPFHTCHTLDVNFALKCHLLSNLPKFYGVAGKDPFKH